MQEDMSQIDIMIFNVPVCPYTLVNVKQLTLMLHLRKSDQIMIQLWLFTRFKRFDKISNTLNKS